MADRRTAAEALAEADLLTRIAPLVPQFTMFGDDNRAAIRAQARALTQVMSESTIFETFAPDDDADDDIEDDDGDRSQHMLDSALDAYRWRTGQTDEKPSTAWMELVPEARRPELEQPGGGRRLVSGDEAVKAKCQHTTPCSDCPWTRKALNGWLGGDTPDEWLQRAHHSNTEVECHMLAGAQCAGLAIYRANVLKRVEPGILVLPKDEAKVFASPMEFKAHHEASPRKASART